ncbi:MAG TPA: ABC transporter permease [Chloroflexia bacterium]|nr:ABC transporter permease [Chloroflexia bacterium]
MAVTAVKVKEVLAPPEPSRLAITWRQFRKHKLGLIGMVTLLILVLACIFVPMIMESTYGLTYETIDDEALATPMIVNGNLTFTKPMFYSTSKALHILGTNEIGRDVFTRLLFAGRISLAVGVITTILVLLLGGLVGILAGFYGGWVDTLLMRFVDLMLAIPSLPILLIASKMLAQSQIFENAFGRGLGSVVTIILVLFLFSWMGISRLVRGSILSLRSLDFIEATRALGASNRRIIMSHLVPNSLAPIIVAATLGVGEFIIAESALSFLGLGIRDPIPSWGNMLEGSRQFMEFITNINPFEEIRGYLVLFPGIMILITVLAINFMGDALRDALDPRLKT